MSGGLVDRLARWLSSPKLAAWLIAILVVMTLVNVLVPQRTYLPADVFAEFEADAPGIAAVLAAVGLDAVFGGWLIAIVGGLLGLSLVVCTVRRLRRLSRTPKVRRPASAERVPLDAARWSDTAAYLDAQVRELVPEGWSVDAREDGGFVARRGMRGIWGSVVLHAGLVIVIIGGVGTVLTAFSGEMLITEGQTVIDAEDAYLSIEREPRLGEPFSGAEITVESFAIEYEEGVIVDVVTRMRGETAGGIVEREVRVNHPLDVGGKSYLLQESGLAAELAIVADQGRETFVVNLADTVDLGWRDTVFAPVDPGDMVLDLTASPRPVGEAPFEDALRVTDPQLSVLVMRAGQPAADSPVVLAVGQTLELPGGEQLVFEGVRTWSRYLVRGEPARWIVYVGFWAAVVGALWRFLESERRLVVFVADDDGNTQVGASMRARPMPPTERDRALVRRLLDEAAGGFDSDDTGSGTAASDTADSGTADTDGRDDS